MGWKKPSFAEDPPANYNSEQPYADRIALIEVREYEMRRKEIQVAKAKILRDQLRKCYIKEGVNQAQNCKHLVSKYLETIQNVGVHRINSGPFDK